MKPSINTTSQLETKYSVVLIPDYLVSTLKRAGIPLQDLDTKLWNSGGHALFEQEKKQICNMEEHIIKIMQEKLSGNDIRDLCHATRVLLHKQILNTDRATSAIHKIVGVANFIDNLPTYVTINNISDVPQSTMEYNNFLQHYCDKTINTNEIIMSDDHNSIFEYAEYQHTLFIIMKKGFTNFIYESDNNFRKLFISRLVTKLYGLGEDIATSNVVFNSFIRL